MKNRNNLRMLREIRKQKCKKQCIKNFKKKGFYIHTQITRTKNLYSPYKVHVPELGAIIIYICIFFDDADDDDDSILLCIYILQISKLNKQTNK